MGIVLITGANRGIGLEFARQYAQEGVGVIATCRRREEAKELSLLAEEFSNLSIEQLDLNSDEDLQALCLMLEKNDVRLDILISNAGVLLNEKFGEWTRQKFADTFDVNVTGAAMLAQSTLPFLSPAGKIVHLSSKLGSLELGGEGMMDADSYSMSKAALNMLITRLASTFKESSKCVVSISPGWVATDMGGASATLSVEESVSSMRRTIGALTVLDSGRFISILGSSIPW
ncbi:MAG: NAD(P)-dependent dehydrogenase (short-subunit alcohol dehydrogenase family) [Candidatus Pelagisphaera sp.]|jgi:NAD(P)-dependent dehydrogenase (short-subunit alcohol dehydrogenase family)